MNAAKFVRFIVRFHLPARAASVAIAVGWLAVAAPAGAEGPGQVSEPAPPEEIGHAVALNPQLGLARTVEAGLHSSTLSGGQSSWSGEYLKGTWQSGTDLTWNGELSDQKRYGDHGLFASLGATRIFDEDWYGSVFAGTSAGGFFLPRLKLDGFVSRKWFEKRNLITTVGLGYNRAKDVHRDRDLFLGASYYFDAPWVLEGGAYVNRSNPGNVGADSGFVALTEGRVNDHYLTVRYSAGREAYQLVGQQTAITDFFSRSESVTWRQWLAPRWGFNLRAEHFANPYYQRNTVEAGIFHDF